MSLYAIDWDSKGRSETVQIVDANTSAVLDTESISNFVNGVYLVWNIAGHVTVNVTATAGPNAVVSGVFFDTGLSPQISSLSTPLGGVGEYMAIYGSNFGTGLNSGTSPCSNCTITFNGAPVSQYQSWENGAISFWVPSNATSGPVIVNVNGVPSNPETFTVVPYPILGSLGIYQGGVGQYVGITGANFGAGLNGGTSPCNNCTVTFNGTPVTDYISWNDINIQVRTPAGFTTGPVQVNVNGTSSNLSATFTLISSPFISSASPNTGTGSGSNPTYVGILGSNFGDSQCSNCSVTFNGTPVTDYQGWSDNTISLWVPAGATTGQIVVHVNGVDSNGSYFSIPGTGIGTPSVYYYIEDMIGTSRVLTDSLGNVCYESDFYPFGGELSPVTDSCPQNYKFTGKERDAESGLDNFGARYFTSSMGRFMSPDPLAGHVEDPQTLNRYVYVRNNPLSLTDPTGLDFYLQCQNSDHSGCTQVQTDPNNNKSQQWVQADKNGNATIITSDSIRAGDNTATVSENGVTINGSSQGIYFDNPASHTTDANGNDVNDNPINLAGSGALSGFNFTINGNCSGTCLSSGSWSYNGSLNAARATLDDRGSFRVLGPLEDIRAGFGFGQHPYSTQHRFGGAACSFWGCADSPHLSVPYDPNGTLEPRNNVPATGGFHVDAHGDVFHHAEDVFGNPQP